jgi:formiminoglutamase
MNLTHFKSYTKQDVLSLVKIRRFETKLGERIQVLNDPTTIVDSLKSLTARYVIIGIPEDIGIQANFGTAGASTAWISFLQSFLNIQSNDFFEGSEVAVIGHFDFGDIQFVIDKNAHTEEEKIEAYRHAVNAIDDEVEGLVKQITAYNKIPIVIGGGHNNAYPIIKGSAKGLYQAQKITLAQINCINLDAHTDYRPQEGRHSGNAFRYAEEDNFLQKYCIVGIHENYLPQNVWVDIVNNPFIDCITYEDIFIHEKRSFRQAVSHAIEFTEDNYAGIELDLDSVENVLSSACSPSGVSILNARQYINLCAAHVKAAYLHICEGATRLNNGKTDDSTGKLVSYLVSDFIKMHEA